jgi:hypothetical protein
MDTPETVDPASPVEWMGPEATRTNEALVLGKSVLLEADVRDRDDFGRLLRYVWIPDGTAWTLVNLELVRRGFASVSTVPPDVRYVELFLTAEDAARESNAGLWGATPPPPTPSPTPVPTPVPFFQPQPEPTAPPPQPKPKPAANCHPSYEGECLTPGIGDYDCAGGSGNGPNYVSGTVQVVGSDEFDLDRDNDGLGCE